MPFKFSLLTYQSMDFLRNLDQDIFSVIHGLSRQSDFLDSVGIFLAEYLTFAIGAFVVIYALWRHHTKAGKPWNFLSVAVIAAGLARSVKVIFHYFRFRARPDASLGIEPLVGSFDAAAFPSGHASVVFALAMVMFFYNHKLGWVLLVLATLVGLARIYVGVHFPLDIIAGAGVGILSAFVVEWGRRKLVMRNRSASASLRRDG